MKFYICFVFHFAVSAIAEDPGARCILAQTESGLVCGARKLDIDGNPFGSFLGVPYAKAPMGELRFAEPQKPEPFSGIFNATVAGPICPQNHTKFVGLYMRPTSMSEDCLHLNIHVPMTSIPDLSADGPKSDKPLVPVLVFIHGGSYTSGSGDPDMHGPEYLLPKGIMVVTLNFRFASFGFLSMYSRQIPGNNGLRDIIFALQWIQTNIKNFGGDPSRVTLGGMSSGAALAHLLSTLPAVKGKNLFHRLILMSNTAISYTVMSPKSAKLKARIFLKGMGLSHLKDPEKIHRALIQAPIGKILNAYYYVFNKTTIPGLFSPSLDVSIKGHTPLIPKDPDQLMDEGYGSEYPALFGFTDTECGMELKNFEKFIKLSKMYPSALIPPHLWSTLSILSIPKLTKMVVNQYFKQSQIANGIEHFCTDCLYKYPALRTIDKRLRAGVENSYLYEFGHVWEGTNPFKRALNLSWTGAAHAADFMFVFRINAGESWVKPAELARNSSNNKIRDFMTDTFSNFVKFGHPGEKLTDWPPTGKKLEHMRIAMPKPIFQPAPAMVEMKTFFDDLYRVGGREMLNSNDYKSDH